MLKMISTDTETSKNSSPQVVVPSTISTEMSNHATNSNQDSANKATDPTTSSGFSLPKKLRFTMGIFSGNLFLIVSQTAKDVYIQEFGASPALIGMYWVILNILAPIINILLGYFIAKYAGVNNEKCGRFGWWFVGSIIIGKYGMIGVFGTWCGVGLVGKSDWGTIEFWFFFFALLNWIGYSSNVLIFDSARCNLFPFKEERVIIESFVKLLWCIALGVGLGTIMYFLEFPSHELAYGLAFTFGLLAFTSFVALDFVQFANQPGEYKSVPFREYIRAFKIDANFYICFVRFFSGILEATSLNMAVYYFNYVNKLSRSERTDAVTYMFVVAAVIDTPFIAIWSKYFGDAKYLEFQKKWMQKIVWGCWLFNGVVCFIWFMIAEMASSPVPMWGMIVIAGLTRALYSPFPYWRIAAQGWAVDEEAIKTGNRNEALFYSLHMSWYEFGRGFISSIIFSGMSFIGGMREDGESCLERCVKVEYLDPQKQKAEKIEPIDFKCMDTCHMDNINKQPEALGLYLRMIYALFIPVCQVLTAYFIYKYPIDGERLMKLNKAQAEVFVRCSKENTKAFMQRKRSKSPNTREVKLRSKSPAALSDKNNVKNNITSNDIGSNPNPEKSSSSSKHHFQATNKPDSVSKNVFSDLSDIELNVIDSANSDILPDNISFKSVVSNVKEINNEPTEAKHEAEQTRGRSRTREKKSPRSKNQKDGSSSSSPSGRKRDAGLG